MIIPDVISTQSGKRPAGPDQRGLILVFQQRPFRYFCLKIEEYCQGFSMVWQTNQRSMSSLLNHLTDAEQGPLNRYLFAFQRLILVLGTLVQLAEENA